MSNISAIIVVKDQPPHLYETLDSVDSLVDEIIIGDINLSPDQIQKLSNNSKIKIHKIASDTPFADVVKEDLKKLAKNEYVLYLDPDEVFPKKTIDFIKTHLNDYDCFLFPRQNIILNRWIEHSRWWPDNQVRLYKKTSVIWPKNVHPQPKITGKQYCFETKTENAIIHYNYDSLDQFLEKATRYAKSEANDLIQTKQPLSLSATINKALSEFISRFFAHEGYRDGMHGFVLAFLQMFYYFLVYFYFWEKNKYQSVRKENIHRIPQLYFKQGLFETNYWLIKQNLISPFSKLKNKFINKILSLFS